MSVRLGDRVKDPITGFVGIAIGITTWLNGCNRVTVQHEKIGKDGKTQDLCFDEPQLVVVKPGVIKTQAVRTEEAERRSSARYIPGGPGMGGPARHRDASR